MKLVISTVKLNSHYFGFFNLISTPPCFKSYKCYLRVNIYDNIKMEEDDGNASDNSLSSNSSSSSIPLRREKKGSVHSIKLRYILKEGRSGRLPPESEDITAEEAIRAAELEEDQLSEADSKSRPNTPHKTRHNQTRGPVNDQFGKREAGGELEDKVFELERRIKSREEKKRKVDLEKTR